jgi:hypothetical protein
MAKPLLPLTISAPGFFGLNTQRAGSVLPMGWATKAENFVFDEVGRLAARKGDAQVNGTVITSSPTVRAIHEYIDGDGNKVNLVACDNKIYKEVSGTMTDVSGTITTPTGDDWQFVNFNGWCVGFQDGHSPIVTTSATSPSFADSSGTQYDGSMVHAAFGRLWTVFESTLYYSDLLINDFDSGSSGSLELAQYWPDGMDEAVAIHDFNGMLIVFGKHSIIIYENADDPTNMTIVEGIAGIGCPYRDTIQLVGDDLVFVSNSGLRSLKRTVIEQSMPLTDLSQHVRDDFLDDLDGETAVQVKSCYNERLGFYIVSLPTAGKTYYFDRRFTNEDGTWRATKWDISPTALHYALDNTMYMAVTAGYLSTYTGYKDGVSSSGSGGSSYTIDYEGVWNDFGEEVSNFIKIPKSVSMLASGTPGGTVSFKWAFDYTSTFNNVTMNFSGDEPPRYGGNFTWGGNYSYVLGGGFERIRNPVGSAGQVIKVGFTTDINGLAFGLQRIDILAKLGRLGL